MATKHLSFLVRSLSLAASIACFYFPAWASAEPETADAGSAEEARHTIKGRTLGDALKDMARRSGISFRLEAGLEREKVNPIIAAKSWSEAARNLLQGYNYAVQLGSDGSWEKVTISGKNGDGKRTGEQPRSGKRFLSYGPSDFAEIPVRYRGLKPGSVTRVNLPLATLKGMKKGRKITLDLPSGQYRLVHDNRFSHDNGDITWVGRLEQEGPPYRAIITMGKLGPMGRLATSDGTFLFVAEDGQTYMIDVDASGLESGSLQEDQATPFQPSDGQGTSTEPPAFWTVGPGGPSASAAPTTNPENAETASQGANSAVKSLVTIDLLALYVKGLDQPDTRINYLADVANQAFLDSKINARIRVVHRQPVDYTETNDNSQALSDLTSAAHPFDRLQSWREKYGADLVTLIRPFHADSQKGCGVAWVNGSGGTGLSYSLAYSVVGEGDDRDGQHIYCPPHVLAHELGHNLGNVHDHALTDFPGAFSYSYAWGVEGVFGTIMSYRQPTLLLFSTPLLGDSCQGQPCGYPEGDPNASDNTRTINQTAPIVSGFQPTVVRDRSQ